MNTLLLQPTDVLFFRDGRPMEGSLAGHGAAWPLPNVTDAAFHAALHRSDLNGHRHDQFQNGKRGRKDIRQFGSLVTAGPFPVRAATASTSAVWYVPRPADLQDDTLTPALLPTDRFVTVESSLPKPLKYAVANRLPPNKEAQAKAWLNAAALDRYLMGGGTALVNGDTVNDSNFGDHEATVGIALDPATGTTGQGEAKGKIYSAQYLRLRDTWRLGVFAATAEKNGTPHGRTDLIPQLFRSGKQLLVGGQQRRCTAELLPGAQVPLPPGLRQGFLQDPQTGKYRVKWILLSPAIWPAIGDLSMDGRPMTPHPGGWLPNWIHPTEGSVLLRHRTGKISRSYSDNKGRRVADQETAIRAKLVAAIVPKPIPVTGWALAHEDADRAEGGAKSTHLAVPAGAVYYFEADSKEDAAALASDLNWHDDGDTTVIRHRRSALLGEKGFGLGVCGTWELFPRIESVLA